MMLRGMVVLACLLASASVQAEMYVLSFTKGSSWDENLAYEQQPGIAAHRKYWHQLYEQEVLLMSGPFEDRSGGLFIVNAANETAVKQFVADDPAVKAGLINITSHRWRVLSSAMRRAKPLVIEVESDRTLRVRSTDPGSPINLPGN